MAINKPVTLEKILPRVCNSTVKVEIYSGDIITYSAELLSPFYEAGFYEKYKSCDVWGIKAEKDKLIIKADAPEGGKK